MIDRSESSSLDSRKKTPGYPGRFSNNQEAKT